MRVIGLVVYLVYVSIARADDAGVGSGSALGDPADLGSGASAPLDAGAPLNRGNAPSQGAPAVGVATNVTAQPMPSTVVAAPGSSEQPIYHHYRLPRLHADVLGVAGVLHFAPRPDGGPVPDGPTFGGRWAVGLIFDTAVAIRVGAVIDAAWGRPSLAVGGEVQIDGRLNDKLRIGGRGSMSIGLGYDRVLAVGPRARLDDDLVVLGADVVQIHGPSMYSPGGYGLMFVVGASGRAGRRALLVSTAALGIAAIIGLGILTVLSGAGG